MILTPVYYPFHNVVTNNDHKLVKVDQDKDHGHFTMNYEAIERAIVDNQVKLFLHCSPHNPAGRVWTEEELGMAGGGAAALPSGGGLRRVVRRGVQGIYPDEPGDGSRVCADGDEELDCGDQKVGKIKSLRDKTRRLFAWIRQLVAPVLVL